MINRMPKRSMKQGDKSKIVVKLKFPFSCISMLLLPSTLITQKLIKARHIVNTVVQLGDEIFPQTWLTFAEVFQFLQPLWLFVSCFQ